MSRLKPPASKANKISRSIPKAAVDSRKKASRARMLLRAQQPLQPVAVVPAAALVVAVAVAVARALLLPEGPQRLLLSSSKEEILISAQFVNSQFLSDEN